MITKTCCFAGKQCDKRVVWYESREVDREVENAISTNCTNVKTSITLAITCAHGQ